MRISKTGGIIAAASKQIARPLLQVGEISVIRRIVITYQQVGIFPIVIITGVDEEEVKRQLSSYGIIFLKNTKADNTELMDSVKIGLSYLQGKCNRIAFTPVNVPMFSPETLSALSEAKGDIIAPSYQGHGGHPVLISEDIIPKLLEYNGQNGLRGAFDSCSAVRTWVEVDDKGIATNIHNKPELQVQLKEHNSAILHPVLHMCLEKEQPFFSERIKLLLFLIADTQNMRVSCEYSGIAHSKAWDMINKLEKNLGYPVVERCRGGKAGGSTKLTEKGKLFLAAYQAFEEEIYRVTQNEYKKRFKDIIF